MIADLKPYAEYKESGMPWLGQVPGHWEVTHLGAVGRFSASGIDKKTVPGEPLVRMINYLDIYRNATHTLRATQTFMVVSCPSEKVQPHNVKRGDLFFTPSSETSEDIGHSAVAMEDIENAVYSYHVIRLRPARRVDLRFSRFWCNNPCVLTQFSVASRGTTRKILDRGDFRRIQVVLPPPNEQALIGRFLDWANGRLERAIRAKRKVIALLNEQKQAIIHRAVTRGLDPSVPLKPSGIPWLGDIPQHWEVQRLKRFCRVQGGYAFPSSAFVETGVPVVRMNNLRRGVLNCSAVARIPESACVPAFSLKAGDILYGLSGSIGTTGSLGNYAVVAEHDLPAMLNQRVARFVPKSGRIEPSLLIQLIQSSIFYEQVLADTTGTAQFNVSTNDIENVAVGLPPRDEQERIVAQIKENIAPLISAVSRLEREIELLREYRTRLVADVVTGKLDVREAAARLPDEAPLDTAEDDVELADETESADEEVAV